MSTQQQPYVPFNEQAALEELERLQRAVEESRQKRKDASAAFDQFVNSFRKEPGREPVPEHRVWPGTDVGPSTIARESRIAPPAPAVSARRRVPSLAVFAGALIATIAGVGVTKVWRDAPAEPAAADISSPHAATAEPLAASAPQPAQPSLPAGSQSELRAVRHVWVRATVDGKRVLERELDAGDRVPLNGRTIVIRAGDAGALRVIIDGQDRGLVGETGIAVTRTYTASAGR